MTRKKKIAALNDALRTTFVGGQVLRTSGVAALVDTTQKRVLDAVRAFDTFTRGNDPYGEHDFGSVTIDGESYYWKIDYYDTEMKFLSEDPTNPAVTKRVLTIMMESEY